jgi:uncharacterized protein (UPF0333 family)
MIKSFFQPMRAQPDAQSGVTLLISVMVMAGVLIISITVAFFVVQEIRSSRSSILTEPAIIAAESAGEQGIYGIKRGSFNADCGTAQYTQLDGSSGGNTNIRVKKCIAYIPAVIELKPTPPLEVYLYDPVNVNGNLCLEQGTCNTATGVGTGAQLYSAFNIKHLQGGSVRVTIVTLDGVPLYNDTIAPESNTSIPIPANILDSSDERLKITLRPTTTAATVELSTNGELLGLPDYRTIDAEGCRSNTNITNCETGSETFNRRINITLPSPQ